MFTGKRKNKRLVAIVLVISLMLSFGWKPIKSYAGDKSIASMYVECESSMDKVKVCYEVSSAWYGGYCASVKVINEGNAPVEDWSLKIGTFDNISNIWNAETVLHEQNMYYVTGNEWNQDIPVNGMVEFGYISDSNFDVYPTFELVGYDFFAFEDVEYGYSYSVSTCWNYGFNSEIILKNLTPNRIDEWQLEFNFDNEITNIWNAVIVSHIGNSYIIKGCEYNQNLKKNDEIKIGFNVSEGESSSVPLNVVLKGSSRKMDKTDNNSHIDYDIIPFPESDYYLDYDNDGVANIIEYWFGLDCYDEDTNHNGSSDYDGLMKFLRDNMTDDSDEDGISDYSELVNGLNPYEQDTYHDGILDGDRIVDTTIRGIKSDVNDIVPLVDIKLYGKQLDSLYINKISNEDYFLNPTIPGYIGNAYDLGVEGDFISSTLRFDMPLEIIENEHPAIYYWNEIEQRLEKVDGEYIEGNQICVNLEHFSVYLPINEEKHFEKLEEDAVLLPAEEKEDFDAIDIVISMDESGSVYSSDFARMKDACGNLIEDLYDNDKIALFTFDDIVRKQSSFLYKDDAKNILTGIVQHDGATSIKDAIISAIGEFSSFGRENVLKVIILLTDGESNSDITPKSYYEIAELAAENNIVIYTIGVGNVSKQDLEILAYNTGGNYYHISDFTKLYSTFSNIKDNAELYLDSDEDGISDYHEKKIAEGTLRLGSGAVVPNYAFLDYTNPDSDGDGVLDGDELSLEEKDGWLYCLIDSLPTMLNSDMDELDDYAEYMMGTTALGYTDPNILIAEPVVVNGYTMPGIGYNTWITMAKDYYWGYIHRQVVQHIIDENVGLDRDQAVGTGFADIIKYDTNEIWEVKPISYYTNEYKRNKAQQQLQRYINGYNMKFSNTNTIAKPGGIQGIKSPEKFPSEDGNYQIFYVNLGDGLIIYSYEPNNIIPENTKEIQKENVIDEKYSAQIEEDSAFISNNVKQVKEKSYVERHIVNSFSNATVSAVLIVAVVFAVGSGGGGGGGIRNFLSDKMNWPW